MPQTFAIYQHLPRQVVTFGIKKRPPNSNAETRHKNLPRPTPKSPSWLQMALPESFWSPTGGPKLQKHAKPVLKLMFLRFALNRTRTPSGRSFWPRGHPNEQPSCPKDAKGPKMVSNWVSFSVFFSFFFCSGCPMESRRVPERPPAP